MFRFGFNRLGRLDQLPHQLIPPSPRTRCQDKLQSVAVVEANREGSDLHVEVPVEQPQRWACDLAVGSTATLETFGWKDLWVALDLHGLP